MQMYSWGTKLRQGTVEMMTGDAERMRREFLTKCWSKADSPQSSQLRDYIQEANVSSPATMAVDTTIEVICASSENFEALNRPCGEVRRERTGAVWAQPPMRRRVGLETGPPEMCRQLRQKKSRMIQFFSLLAQVQYCIFCGSVPKGVAF